MTQAANSAAPKQVQTEVLNQAPKEATASVIAQQAAMLNALPFSDTADFDDASRGFLGTLENAAIANAQGRVVWSLEPYGFLSAEEAPTSVNPSLWRQAQLNAVNGLFKVTERVYQVHGLDIANMTIIEGEAGLILIDPLLSNETAKAALDEFAGKVRGLTDQYYIEIQGHTDDTGGKRYNEDLGERRAETVRRYLSRSAGLPLMRMSTISYGDTLPVAPNKTRAGRAQNRRVVIVVLE